MSPCNRRSNSRRPPPPSVTAIYSPPPLLPSSHLTSHPPLTPPPPEEHARKTAPAALRRHGMRGIARDGGRRPPVEQARSVSAGSALEGALNGDPKSIGVCTTPPWLPCPGLTRPLLRPRGGPGVWWCCCRHHVLASVVGHGESLGVADRNVRGGTSRPSPASRALRRR